MHKPSKNYACANFCITDTKILHFLYKYFAIILYTFCITFSYERPDGQKYLFLLFIVIINFDL